MRLFGYRLDAGVAEERLVPGPLDEPLFRQGNEIGCLVLHGISGTPANVRALSDRLSRAGYTVSAPLIAGHGGTVRELDRSTGEAWLRTAESGYEALKAAGCTKIFSVGLSLGGVLTGLLAEEKDLTAAVMICPPLIMKPFLRISRWISPLFPYVRYDSSKRKADATDGYHNSLSGMATRKLADLSLLSLRLRANLRKITCPFLAVEAGKDNKVAKKTYRLLRERTVNAPERRFVCFPDSPHGCTYSFEREKIADCVADYIREKAEK